MSAPHILWDIEEATSESQVHLPKMETDVVLRSDAHTIILDAKYYSETLRSRHERQAYHSGNLYQLFAYLKNAEAKGGSYEEAEGMLFYPTVEVELDDAFTVQGHRMRVCTINLAQEWQGIHDDLLALVEDDEVRS